MSKAVFAVSEDKIREAAYLMWKHEGEPHGKDEEHWHRAAEALTPAKPARKAPAKKAAPKAAAAKAPAKAPAKKPAAKKTAAKKPAAKAAKA
jgi:hypothetical protein